MDLSFYSTSIHSQMLFISLCKVMYLLFHFLSKELVLTFLNRQVCYQPNPSISIYMITHLFFLHFDNISGYYDNFSGYRILGWWFFFSLNTKYFTPLLPCLHGFWEVQCNSDFSSCIGGFPHLRYFQDYFFFFDIL